MTEAVGPTETGIRGVFRMPEVRAAMLGTFTIMLGYGIVAPVLPDYAQSFGVGKDAVGLLISGFSFARLVADPFVGRVIDRWGQRSMVALGAAFVGVSSIAAGLAPNFPLLLVFRSAGGLGSSLFFAALLSYLLRIIPTERSGRVMGVYYGSFNVGLIAGGPLGGLFAEWLGRSSVLHIYGVACFVAAVLFWRTIRDPARDGGRRPTGGVRHLPWGRPFVAVLLANGAYLWITGAVFSTLIPLFGKEAVGLSLGGIGIALAVATAVELVCLYPAGRAGDRRGHRAVLVPALAGYAVITALLGFASSTVAFMGGMAVLGVASAFSGVPPAPMLSDVTPEESRVAAVGVFRLVGDVGFVLGPLVAGWSAEHAGYHAAFALSAVPLAFAFAFMTTVREPRPRLPRSKEAPGL